MNQVKELILAQGIVSRVSILPETDLLLNLNYQPTAVAALFRMTEREFKINCDPTEFTTFTRLGQITQYIQASCPISNPLLK